MTTHSISFDQAANIYDQTRHLAEPMATHGLQVILDLAGPHARILEVGAGTGRISVPLLQRGANLIGCDLSIEMMSKLREKLPVARLAQANAARLPFASEGFDALITIHVLHLVGPWRAALREFKRVLRPNGVYINNWNRHDETSASVKLRNYWRGRVEAQGANWRRPGIQNREELIEELKSLAASVDEIEVARFFRPFTPRETIEDLAQRVYSDTWDIPEDIFNTTIDELREWAAREYGNLDQTLNEEHRFVFDVARFG